MQHLIRIILGNALAAAIGLAAPPTASAQTGGMPDYGLRWSVIGSPGNAPAIVPPGQQYTRPGPIGAVGYEYRIAQTEVSVGQWWEFMNAYAPHTRGDLVNALSVMPSRGVVEFFGLSNGVPQYRLTPGTSDQPAFVGYRGASRYLNWLHNGKPTAANARPEDFERGAYDISTFGVDPNNIVTDQISRSPGARFFFPTFNEWTKAVYFDPNRYGPGQPGYWTQPNGTDTPLVRGRPENGGQTNASPWPAGQSLPVNVGSYPTVRTPWGLLDASGGGSEFLDDVLVDVFNGQRTRLVTGSDFTPYSLPDRLGSRFDAAVGDSVSLRVASVVPAPPVVMVPVVYSLIHSRRRR